VGGFVFAVVRLLVAAWPWLALRAPGKKIAAAAGLAAILAYLAISGAPPAAERAAITASVAFLAMLCDRKALSLHSLAVAALVVLALGPEAIMQPGFQMSFAATAALLALAEAWPRPTRELNTPWPIRLVQGLRVWLTAGFLVSLVAGLATGPFAIQHFNRVTLWGLPANLATEALSTFVIMPALAVGALLELFGLGAPLLAVAGWGLERMVALAKAFAAWPYAVQVVASAPDWTLALSFLGLLFICLWRGRLRWLGLLPFAAVAVWPRPPTPDVWIAAGGANLAVAEAGRSLVLRPDVQSFGRELWSNRRGLVMPGTSQEAAWRALAYRCDRDACTPLAAAPVKVAAWWRRRPPREGELAELCNGAELVVLRTGEGVCPGRQVVNEAMLKRGGAAELYRTPQGWRMVWAQDLRGRRPWSTAEGDEPGGG
jgi:competence protein ComEC